MPQIEETLTSTYRGRTFDVAKASENEDWFDQGGPHPRRASGLPKKSGLWLYSFSPLQGCCDHQFELILFVSVTKTGKVRQIKTGVYRSYSPSAIEEIEVEFFTHDLEQAKTALEEVLTPVEAAARPGRRPRSNALDIVVLTQLIGTSIRRKLPRELVSRFGLSRAAAQDGHGSRYTAPRARLQVVTDDAGLITGVLFKPAVGDRLLEKPLELPGEAIDAVRRGHVRAALGLPTESSQRPDYDRFAYAHHEVRFSYAQRGGSVSDVRISPVQAAC